MDSNLLTLQGARGEATTSISTSLTTWLQHGPACAKVFPVDLVYLVDRVPYYGNEQLLVNDKEIFDRGPYFMWVCYHNSPEIFLTHHIPKEVFKWLSIENLAGSNEAGTVAYTKYQTAEQAMKDLSRACVRYAKNPKP